MTRPRPSDDRREIIAELTRHIDRIIRVRRLLTRVRRDYCATHGRQPKLTTGETLAQRRQYRPERERR